MKIGYATSPDGLVWTKKGSTAVLTPRAAGSWDEECVSSPIVIKAGSTYKIIILRCVFDGMGYPIWYSGSDAIAMKKNNARTFINLEKVIYKNLN